MNTQSLDVTKIKVHPRFTAEQAKYWLLIREAILFEGGKHYDQQNWDIVDDCGSACCILGHASLAIFHKPYMSIYNAGDESVLYEKLGLLNEEDFTVSCAGGLDWKSPFNTQFKEAQNQQAQASVAGNYILSILETGEV